MFFPYHSLNIMPRKLPWQTASSRAATHPKRTASSPAIKRQKLQKRGSESEEEGSLASSKKANSHEHGGSFLSAVYPLMSEK